MRKFIIALLFGFLLFSTNQLYAEKLMLQFTGNLNESDEQHTTDWGEYTVGTPFCGALIYESEQENPGDDIYRATYSYDQLIVVLPDDSDADNLPNYLIDYGNAEEDPTNGNFDVSNHHVGVDDIYNPPLADGIHAYSYWGANGLAVNNAGSKTVGGIQAGNPDDGWDWVYEGIQLAVSIDYKDGIMFPNEQGSNLPDSLNMTEDSIDLDFARSYIELYAHSENHVSHLRVLGNLTSFSLGPINVNGFDSRVPHVEYLSRLCGF